MHEVQCGYNFTSTLNLQNRNSNTHFTAWRQKQLRGSSSLDELLVAVQLLVKQLCFSLLSNFVLCQSQSDSSAISATTKKVSESRCLLCIIPFIQHNVTMSSSQFQASNVHWLDFSSREMSSRNPRRCGVRYVMLTDNTRSPSLARIKIVWSLQATKPNIDPCSVVIRSMSIV